jgi:hypothetical protein
LLDRSRQRRVSIERAVLVPRRRQPISGEGDRQRTANHETEVSWSRRRYHRAIGELRELLDDLRRIVTALGHSFAADFGQQLL